MTTKYLQYIPKPLLKDFERGKVIPFVGAGFSKNADIPDGMSMPDWNELGKIVASEIPDYSYENMAIDTLSYYEESFSRTKLVELLMESLNVGIVRPSQTYNSFCELFDGRTICTTNFDSLLEDAMTLLQKRVSVITSPERLAVDNNGESRILKLHGDFNHPERMVITERDYDLYLTNNPIFATYVANLFINNTILLIGYSLDDADFRSIWQIINSRLGKMNQPAYCITVGASPEKIERYRRRNIRVININGKAKDYKSILATVFEEIKQYIDQDKDRNAKSDDSRINVQMKIPAENNRLCFLSCSSFRLAWLSDLLNPIMRMNGVELVRLNDMLMPGDNWLDVSKTAIRKAKAAIVDVSDKSINVGAELQYIASIKERENVLLIAERGTQVVSTLSGFVYAEYDNHDSLDIEGDFVDRISRWIHEVFGEIVNEEEPFKNARRLLKKKEYSASILSAYSELEYNSMILFRNSMSTRYKRDNSYKPYKRMMMEVLSSNSSLFDKYRNFTAIRNRLAHENHSATLREAKQYLDTANLIMQELHQVSVTVNQSEVSV